MRTRKPAESVHRWKSFIDRWLVMVRLPPGPVGLSAPLVLPVAEDLLARSRSHVCLL